MQDPDWFEKCIITTKNHIVISILMNWLHKFSALQAIKGIMIYYNNILCDSWSHCQTLQSTSVTKCILTANAHHACVCVCVNTYSDNLQVVSTRSSSQVSLKLIMIQPQLIIPWIIVNRLQKRKKSLCNC